MCSWCNQTWPIAMPTTRGRSTRLDKHAGHRGLRPSFSWSRVELLGRAAVPNLDPVAQRVHPPGRAATHPRCRLCRDIVISTRGWSPRSGAGRPTARRLRRHAGGGAGGSSPRAMFDDPTTSVTPVTRSCSWIRSLAEPVTGDQLCSSSTSEICFHDTTTGDTGTRGEAPGNMPALPPIRPPTAPPYFHVLAKPTGPICNLDCEYCFFLSKESLYPGARSG